jgi:cell pole-organizing protein PopZ
MAPASSAQREPSMEEILASIRRIIEDSDAAQKRPDEPPSRFPANEPVPAVKAEIEAFRAELRPIPEVAAERRPPAVASSETTFTAARTNEPPQVTDLAPKPFRLAEVQAQVAREAAAQSKAPEPEKRPVTLAEVQQQLAKEPAVPTAVQSQPPEPERRPVILTQVHQQLSKETVVPPPATAMSTAHAPSIPAAPVRPSPVPDQAALPTAEAAPQSPLDPVALDLRREEPVASTKAAQESAVDAAPKPAIISPSAGRQVAAAFGELSEAFSARSKKTFDDLAEQMLRPMLQDWLDNNLPILVERLVREEIERVARGAE